MTIAFVVVDDNGAEREVIADLLRRAMPDAQILQANGGDEALNLVEERRLVPSLVFTDIAMDGGGGIDLIAGLRRVRWLERTPVAVVSDLLSDREVLTAYRLGACAVLTKPARLHELRDVIREFAQPAKRMSAGTVRVGLEMAQRRSAA